MRQIESKASPDVQCVLVRKDVILVFLSEFSSAVPKYDSKPQSFDQVLVVDRS